MPTLPGRLQAEDEPAPARAGPTRCVDWAGCCEFWQGLDARIRAYLILLTVIEIPFLLPWLTHPELARYSAVYPLICLPIAAALPLLGLGRLERRGDRAFWRLIALAFGFWTVQSAILSAARFDIGPRFSAGWRDGLLGLCYLAWFVAAGVHTRRAASDPLRRIEIVRWLSLSFFAAGLIAYCAAPRFHLDAGEQRSGPSLLAAYCLLDLALALRFRWLASDGTPSWRRTHAWLATAHLGWLALDLVQGFEVWNQLPILGHPRAEPLWNLPFLFVALAVNTRLSAAPEPPNVTASASPDGRFDRGPLALLVVAAPVGHILLSQLGLISQEWFVVRAWIVFTVLLGLAFAAALETRMLRRLAAEATAARFENEQLRIAREVDARARASQRAFLANVSHELRTPMTGLLGLADLLLDSEMQGESRDRLTLLRASARQLLRVIDDVLEASRLEHGNLPIVVEPISPRDLSEQTVALLATEAAVRGLAVSLEVADDLPARIAADGGRIRQMLTNLLANAIKFTDQGTIRVRAEVARPFVDGEGVVRYSVLDRGIGVPEGERGRLFQPFEQLNPAPLRRRGGTGLGLAISKRYVEAMGGAIGYEPRAGGGSHFWFEVPVRALQPLARGIEVPARSAVGVTDKVRTILLAEDDPVSRMISEATLQALGYRVVTACDGREALEVAISRPFDAILLDCQMPELDGFEVARRLRGIGRRLPILALTARAFDSDRTACLAAGMDDYLAKPFDRAALAALLERWLEPATCRP